MSEKEKARLEQAKELVRSAAATGLREVLSKGIGSFLQDGYLELDPNGGGFRLTRKGLLFVAFALKTYDLFTLGNQTMVESLAIVRESTRDESARQVVEEAMAILRKAGGST